MISAAIVACSTVAIAEIYEWTAKIRPVVELDAAFKAAIAAIDNPAFYCIRADLYGNEEGANAPGSWTLVFASKTGEQKYVQVTFTSEGLRAAVAMDFVPPEPRPPRMRLRNLTEVEDALSNVLQLQERGGQISISGKTVTASVNTREYVMNRLEQDGTYSTDVTTISGPEANGIVVRVTDMAEGRPQLLRDNPWGLPFYFHLYRGVFAGAAEHREFLVEIDYGKDVAPELLERVTGLFGTPRP
jgi:hypothetical protein